MGIVIQGGVTIESGISITNEYALPTNSGLPVASGNIHARGSVTTTNGTWSTIFPITSYAYQWQRDLSNIGGATTNSYTNLVSDIGSNLQCVVTATNSHGIGMATSNSLGPILASVPLQPLSVTAAINTSSSANVTFSAPSSDGGASITSYTVTSSPGGLTATRSSPGTVTITGLTTTVLYTFTVTATNSAGTSAPSAPSNSIRSIPAIGEAFRGGYFLLDNGSTYTVLGPVANTLFDDFWHIAGGYPRGYYSLNINGYTDWDPGLRNEVNAAYLNKATFAAIGQGFTTTLTNVYWTGVQKVPFTDKLAYDRNFVTGAEGTAIIYSVEGGPLQYARPYRRAAW